MPLVAARLLLPSTSLTHSVMVKPQWPATMAPLRMLTTLTRNSRKVSRDSSMLSRTGSMSYLKKMPGMARSEISPFCSVTAYWLVKMVEPKPPADDLTL